LEPDRPPLPVEVVDLKNFSRLVLGLTVETPPIWHFRDQKRSVLGVFVSYLYWKGGVPLFTYVLVDETDKPFLAYRSESPGGEQFSLTSEVEDPKFRYAPLLHLEEPPEIIAKSLRGEVKETREPLLVKVKGINSLARVLLALASRMSVVFPLWHFTRSGKHIIGTCIPFEHYYEADALPIFFYAEQGNPPEGSFIRYRTSKLGESIGFAEDTSDAKYFYVKLITVKDFPLFPQSRK
jgi:hypothetical protein